MKMESQKKRKAKIFRLLIEISQFTQKEVKQLTPNDFTLKSILAGGD
jgi:hypothetical protein